MHSKQQLAPRLLLLHAVCVNVIINLPITFQVLPPVPETLSMSSKPDGIVGKYSLCLILYSVIGVQNINLKAEMCVVEYFIYSDCSFLDTWTPVGRWCQTNSPTVTLGLSEWGGVGGGGAWNNDHIEIRLITPLVAVPEAPLTLGSVCQFSIPIPEQNNREHFIYSVCPHNRAAQPLC